jgi:hypothetical protein
MLKNNIQFICDKLLRCISIHLKSVYLYAVLIFFSLNVTLLIPSATAEAHDKNYSESKVKTALIYNLLHFIDWPSKNLVICIYDASEDYISSFKAIPSSTKTGNTLDIKFLHLSGESSTQNSCHIIFVTDNADNKNLRDMLASAKSSHRVTIGETKQFIKQGGMISFVRKGSNIKFEINAKAFEQADLKISSQVLRMADHVYTESFDE